MLVAETRAIAIAALVLLVAINSASSVVHLLRDEEVPWAIRDFQERTHGLSWAMRCMIDAGSAITEFGPWRSRLLKWLTNTGTVMRYNLEWDPEKANQTARNME
jgi:hypothetical protein